jgi:protein SCO1/2
MPRRLRWVLTGLIICTAAAVGAVIIADRGNDGGASAKTADGFAGARRPPGIPPQDFALRDQDGKPASLAQYRGQVVVLTFMYSTCKDTCPLQADQIRGALDDLGGDAPPALTVSVDPANDTPDRAKSFLLKHALTGRMRFLLGSRPQLAPVWKAYGIQPQGAAFDHSAYVLLIDKQGRQRIGFPLNQLTPEGLAHDIRVLTSR